MMHKSIPLPSFQNIGLFPLLLNRIDKLNKCFESLGTNQKNYLTYLLLNVSDNNTISTSLDNINEDDIKLYASIIAYYITIDGNTTYESVRCCLNDDIIDEVDAPHTSDKWFGEIACQVISTYCKDRKNALISLNNSGGWLTPEARLYLNLEPPCSKGTLACLYIPIIKRALEMFLAYFDEGKVSDDSKKEIILLITGILSDLRMDDVSVRFSGLPTLLERMTCLLVVNDDCYLVGRDRVADLNEYKRNIIEFGQSIIDNTPGACRDDGVSTTRLSYYFEKCSKIHMKSGSDDGSIRWLELEYSKFNYWAYTRLYLTKDVANYTFEDLYNERYSLYANDPRDMFKRDKDNRNYAYIEKYDAEMKCANDEISRYICEKSNVYRYLYMMLLTGNEEIQILALNRLKECIFDNPLSSEFCYSGYREYILDPDNFRKTDSDIEFLKELKGIVLAVGRFVNKQENDLPLYKYDEFWSELLEAFDF
ncbi:MAG: hypothetical protein MSA35_07165 [Prevotella sp.]|nr:hypothetical protein [Prevotella sp.]